MKIKDAFRYDELEEFLNAPIEYFQDFGRLTHTPDGMIYIHNDIGANILGVAHLDSVNAHDHFYVCNFAGNDTIFNTHLDDRLGAYIILVVLPRMGIHTDILLTEGEEIGKSTAKHFRSNKQYKWMFSFDRRGDDVVHYRYSDPAWVNLLRTGFKFPTHGSVSDIDYLGHLGCCGLNIGTGYHNEHDLRAYMEVNETISQIGKFIQFYQTHKGTHHPFVQPPPPPPAPSYRPYIPPTSPLTIVPVSEEREDLDTLYNPYEDMDIDIPMDIHEYTDASGIVTPPTQCAFCLEPVDGNTHAFMGICADCESFAVECVVCHEFFDRVHFAQEDMGEELFWGICRVCEAKQNSNLRRFNVNNIELQTDSYGARDPHESDSDDTGDESTPTRRID